MAKSLHVLVTGSAGRIGRAVVRELKARGHFVRGFNLVATPGADEFVVSDLADAAGRQRNSGRRRTPPRGSSSLSRKSPEGRRAAFDSQLHCERLRSKGLLSP